MLLKGKRHYALGLFMGIALSASFLMGSNVCATETEDSEEEVVELMPVDMSQGITYIYAEDGETIQGINLNGNSVIIEASENGETNQYNNLYIDKDRDGVIDEDETMATVGGSVDVMASASIYGVYERQSTTPISITINSGYVPVVYGVHTGAMVVEGETAVSIKLVGGTVPGTVFGSYESRVTADGAGAVEVIVDTESTTSTSAIMCAYNTTVAVKNAGAPGISLQLKNGVGGTVYGMCSSSYTMTNCTGVAVDLDVVAGNYSTLMAMVGGSFVSDGTNETMIDIDMTGGMVTSFYGANSMKLDAGKNTNTILDADITGSSVISAYFYGINGSSSNTGSDNKVVGNVDVNCNLTAMPDSGYNVYSFYALNYYVVLDGSVNVYINNVRINNAYVVNSSVKILGDYTYETGENVDIYANYGMYSSMAEGDVTLNLYGLKENSSSSYNYVYGVYGGYTNSPYVIGGDYTFNYKGGMTNTLYVAYCYNGLSTGGIKGNVDVNIDNATYSTFYGIYYISAQGNYTLDIGKDCTCLSNFYVASYSEVGGDLTSNVYNNNTSSNKAYYYGVYYSSVKGNVTCMVDGGYYYYLYGIYGGNGTVLGNADITFKNINKGLTVSTVGYNYTYGIESTTIEGTVQVDISDCVFGSLYASSYANCSNNIDVNIENVDVYNYIYGIYTKAVGGNAKCTIEGVTAEYLYGMNLNGACGGTVDCVITDAAVSGSLYGIQGSYTEIAEDTSVTINNSSAQYFYGISNMVVCKDLDVDVNGGTYGNASYGCFYGVSGANVIGTTDVSVSGATITGYLFPCNTSSSTPANSEITVSVDNTVFVGSNGSTPVISNSVQNGQTLHMNIADDCTIPDNVVLQPSSSGRGYAVAEYNDAIYYGGQITFEDTTEDTIYLTAGAYYIPKDVTVKVNKGLYYQTGELLLEGILDATFAGTQNEDGIFTNTNVYVNGGTMTQDLATMQSLYYPVNINYLEKAGSVSTSSNFYTHALGGAQKFARYGVETKFTATANEGYSIEAVTATPEGAEAATNVTCSNGVYSFTMTDKPTDVDVTFIGNAIVLGKTVADPVVKAGQAYTAETPIYDLSTVSISNDAKEGEVTYAVDETYGLPNGLVLENGKIYGTTTEINEQGKKAVILVTGKNGYVAELSLNIVVTEGEGTQTSQEGRITVDDTNQIVYLSGNSVVLDSHDSGTAIYLDNDKDGAADYASPAYVGDISTYTMYGIRNADYGSNIRITMNGGTVGTIYGVYNGAITCEGLGLEFYMNGGTAGSFYALSNADISGTMKTVIGTEATLTSYTMTSGTCSSRGYYSDRAGTVAINGSYTVDEDITATSLTLNASSNVTLNGIVTVSTMTVNSSAKVTVGGNVAATGNITINSSANVTFHGNVLTEDTLKTASSAIVTFKGTVEAVDLSTASASSKTTFEKNVTVADEFLAYGSIYVRPDAAVNTKSLSKYSGTKIYLEGSLAATSVIENTSSYIYMLDGASLSDSVTWAYVYYQVTKSSDLEGTTISISTNNVTVDGITYAFLRGGATYSLTTTSVKGYTYEYTIGNSETVASASNSYSFTMPKAKTAIAVSYVPTQITVENFFAQPIGAVGTTYTTEKPLYDLTNLIVNNDTTVAYGSDIKYELAKDSVLPAGLSLESGKIVGTPTTENTAGDKVSFVITGRNGTSATIDLTISIEEEGYEPSDINADVTISDKIIHLNGKSIVVYADATDSSKSRIYPDYNMDKIADNSLALEIDGVNSYDLSTYHIYGYDNTEETYQGDISITLYGGIIGGVYGVTGRNATVDGTIGLYVYGGTISYASYMNQNGSATNVNVEVTSGKTNMLYCNSYGTVGNADVVITGGTLNGVYGSRYGTIDNVNIKMTNGTVTSVYGSYYATCKDIDVELAGGSVTKAYGAYNGSAEDVSVKVTGTNLSSSTTYGACNVKVNNLNFELTGGTYSNSIIYGMYNGSVSENYNFVFGDTAIHSGTSNNYPGKMYVSYGGIIYGDANVTIGADSSSYGFSGSYTYFYGLNGTKTKGNVNYILDGYWKPNRINYLVYGGSVEKDINLRWKSGTMAAMMYCGYSTSLTGNLNIEAEENATISGTGTIVGLYNCTAENINANIPDSCTGTVNLTLLGNNASVNKTAYAYNKGGIIIGGQYAIAEDLAATTLTILENADVTIMEGVTVSQSASSCYNTGSTVKNYGTMQLNGYPYIYGTLENYGTVTLNYASYIYGTLDNYGTLTSCSSYTLGIGSGGCVINRESGTWTAAGRINSSGIIYNYGDFTQTYTHSTYYKYLGTVYAAKALTLSKGSSYASNYISYSSIYCPVTLDYPSHCVEEVSLASAYTASSGIEGDDNIYIKAGGSFTVTPSETLLSTVELDSVTYGSSGLATTKQSDGSWVGTAPLEPFTVTLNYVPVEDVTNITLGKSEDRIENTDESTPLVVNKYYSSSSPLYDLTSIEIIGDIEEEGVVTYSVDSSSTLPTGLTFKNGKLYGTLKAATAADQRITFVIKGKNQTSAFFTLTLGPVKKYVPSWSAPTGLQTIVNKTLSSVELPYSSYGTYSWPDSTVSVGSEITTLTDVALNFTPNDTNNYDWETAATNAGATYEGGVITCKVSVQVCAGKPTYTAPTGLTATYGQTFGEVEIPSGDNNGTFSWNYDDAVTVGNVGTHYYYVTYTPNDTVNYQTVTRILVTLTVTKAVPTYEKMESLTSACGVTLADIELPTVDNGVYTWITTPSTVAVSGKTYQLGLKPSDTSNYDWTALEDWNSAWECVVFPVVVNLTHDHETTWTYDNTYHWHACATVNCKDIIDKAVHTWDDGTVVKAATDTAKGSMKYTCACGATKTEDIPMKAHTIHTYKTTWSYDSDSHWHECTHTACDETKNEADHVFDAGVVVVAATEDEEGMKKYTCQTCGYSYTDAYDLDIEEDDEPLEVDEEFEDEESKVTYLVTAKSEIQFVETGNTSATELVIPDTVTFGGVTYKVTSIGNEAFKNHKTLKQVVIGSNVVTIGKKAFYGCKKLTSVTIGINVIKIGDSAFQNCTALKSINIPSKVTTIGNKAFYGCKKLTTVKMGKNVAIIETSAFQNCVALKKIELPSKVKKVGAKAFYGCKKLTNITIKTTKLNTKNVGKQAFTKAGSSNYKKLTVKVPKKKLKAYKAMLKKRGLSSKAKVKK